MKPSMPRGGSEREVWGRADWLVALTLVVASAFFVGLRLCTGWVPSDEGTLAQSALRVYQGQLPHRDFAEIYSGGLSMLHALGFRLFGVNLFSLRLVVFLFFLAWVPVVYFCARQFLSPLWAAVATATAVSWSYPNYVAAMPSWYNLFFATCGAAALLRYLDRRARWWLLLAGVCGGLSIAVKITGLYYVAAALMFVLYLEQSANRASSAREGHSKASYVYGTICSVLLVVYLMMLGHVLRPQIHAAEFFHFMLPSIALVAVLLWRERAPGALSSRARFERLLAMVLPFAAGLGLVLALFLLPYAASGSLRVLLRGIAGSAGARMTGLAGRFHPPGLFEAACYGLPTIALLVCGMVAKWPRRTWVVAAVGLVLGGVVVFCALQGDLQDPWMMAGTLTPLLVVAGSVFVLRGGTDALAEQQAVLFLALSAVCSLVQFPVSYVTYFCYVAPLTLLAAIAVVKTRREVASGPLLATLLLFFFAFGLFAMVPKHVFEPKLNMNALHALSLPRAGKLRVDATTPDYEQIVPFLQAHSVNGLLYAGNDCPELYFLSGLRNPTRDDTGAPPEQVLAALRKGDLSVVAINEDSLFASGTTSTSLQGEIQSFLPHLQRFGRFDVYWR